MSRYTHEQLKSMAWTVIDAKRNRDPRADELIMRLCMIRVMTPTQVLKALVFLANVDHPHPSQG